MKKFLSVLLVACLLVCSFPLDLTYAETIDPFEDDDDIRVIIPFKDNTSAGGDILKRMESEIETDPSGFSSDTSNPYGLSGDDTVTLLTKDEVFEFISINNNAVRADFNRYIIDSDGSTSRQSANSSGLSLSNESLNNLGYAQGVSFDPTGCGRNNYVAIIGYKANSDRTNGSAHVVIINADKNSIVKDIELDTDKFGWIANYKLGTVASKNFFQITSGDYDGDGRDSLVVWDGCNMYEIYTSIVNSSLTYYVDSTNLNKKTLNINWRLSGAASSTNVNDRLGVSLASGDVNGDGIDDLVAVSCAGEMSKDYCDGYGLAMAAKLHVVFGEENARLSAATYEYADVYEYDKYKGHTVSMAAPGVAIGDINGDGVNEIVCAGFESEVNTFEKIDVKDGKTKVLVYAWYTVTKNTKGEQELNCKKFSSSMTDISAISKDDSLRENGGKDGEKNWQQVSVECVAFDGMNTTDYVFINGYVYKLNTKSSELESVYKPDVFSTLKTHVNDFDVNEVFIYSAAVGNFYQSNKGEESIVLVVGYRRNQSDRYYFQRVILRKTNGTWKEETKWDFCEYRVFTDSGLLLEGAVPQHKDRTGCRTSGSLSCCIVAVDYGYDSMVAKYNKKVYLYTDPNVVAVLQAAPYFEEFDAGNSSTKYGYSESYKKSESSGSEVSFGVGISAELQAGAVKTEVEEIVTNGITEEYEESLTTEYFTYFEANDKNQVILRRTLVYIYYYDIVSGTDSNGNYTYNESQIVISVPQYPVMTQLSIEQYNDFATEYNNTYGAGLESASYYLDKISEDNIKKYYLDNEGNPYNYAADVSAYKYGYELTDSKTWMQLGHAGGTSEQGYSSELEKTVTTVVSEGVSCNMKLMLGGGWGSFEAYVGVTASMDALRTKGVSTATITKTETSGAVQNLSGSDEDMKYNFDWKAIAWKTEGDLFNGVLFVGYAVKPASISSLPVPVSDLTATFPSDKEDYVLLEWKSPDQDERRPQVTEFRIFSVDNGTYTEIGRVDNAGNGKTHTYYYDATKYDKAIITFAVQAVRNVANDSAKSKYSNEATCILTLTAMTVKEMIDSARTDLQAKIDALEETLENGTSNAVTKAIEDLTAAYKAADEVLKEYIDDTAEDIKASIKELEDTLKESDEALDSAIKQVQENLDSAVEELKGLIADGDKANTDELLEAVEKLTDEYKAADSLLNENMDDLSDAMKAADDVLSAAIDKVQKNLDKAVEDLNKAIVDGDKINADDLKKSVSELTNAYKAADSLLKADISALQDKVSALEKTVADADSSLQNAIVQVRENLDNAKKELQSAIDANKDDVDAEIEKLKTSIEAANAVTNDSIEALDGDFSQQLKELKDKIAKDNAYYDDVIELFRQMTENQQNTINAWKTISVVSLCVGGASLTMNIVSKIMDIKKKKS